MEQLLLALCHIDEATEIMTKILTEMQKEPIDSKLLEPKEEEPKETPQKKYYNKNKDKILQKKKRNIVHKKRS